MNLGICDRCQKAVRWVTTNNGRPMPLNPEPDPAGNVVIDHTDPNGKEHVHVLKKDEDPVSARFVPHIATCGK